MAYLHAAFVQYKREALSRCHTNCKHKRPRNTTLKDAQAKASPSCKAHIEHQASISKISRGSGTLEQHALNFGHKSTDAAGSLQATTNLETLRRRLCWLFRTPPFLLNDDGDHIHLSIPSPQFHQDILLRSLQPCTPRCRLC